MVRCLDADFASAKIEAAILDAAVERARSTPRSSARLHEIRSEPQAAIRSYRTALSSAIAPHQRSVIERKLARLA